VVVYFVCSVPAGLRLFLHLPATLLQQPLRLSAISRALRTAPPPAPHHLLSRPVRAVHFTFALLLFRSGQRLMPPRLYRAGLGKRWPTAHNAPAAPLLRRYLLPSAALLLQTRPLYWRLTQTAAIRCGVLSTACTALHGVRWFSICKLAPHAPRLSSVVLIWFSISPLLLLASAAYLSLFLQYP